MSRRRYREIGVRPFAVVLPDPDSRGRWLFYVGDVFIDDCHTARAGGGYDEHHAGLAAFRERASAINAAVEGLTMSDHHAASWSVILDALHEKGGEVFPGFAKTLALAMGVDVERFPELAPRPAPPPPAIDIRHGARVRYRYNGTEFDAVVVATRVLEPPAAPPLLVEYSALQETPIALRGLAEPMRVRVEVELLIPTEPSPTARVGDLGGQLIPPDVAAQLLELEPGAVVRGEPRSIVLPPGSYQGVRVTNVTGGGTTGALEVRLQCSSSPRTWAPVDPNPAPLCELEAGHDGMCRAGAMAWVYSGGEAVLVSPGSTS